MSENQGTKKDAGKPDMSLLPSAALLEEAQVWTFGQKKYAAFNWHRGLNYRRVLGAIGRHLALLNAGIDVDPETGNHHAAAIRCGCAMIIQYSLEKRTELDDRMIVTQSTKDSIEKMSMGEKIWDLLKESDQQTKE